MQMALPYLTILSFLCFPFFFKARGVWEEEKEEKGGP